MRKALNFGTLLISTVDVPNPNYGHHLHNRGPAIAGDLNWEMKVNKVGELFPSSSLEDYAKSRGGGGAGYNNGKEDEEDENRKEEDGDEAEEEEEEGDNDDDEEGDGSEEDKK
ncbi:hypothetical protein CRG98_036407 [Punica granatum]|uniref:Uncharacterized protein n=1 Tax=Punica granatum TaxID=22663 RepID=A0A2I0IHN3_PUNGR|nr:hypothetical protein CRG98_036407 [Punica granatum]